MIIKFIIAAAICTALVSGGRSTRGVHRTQTTNKVSQKQGSSPPKQELLAFLGPDTRAQRSTRNYHTADNYGPSTGHHQQTANVHQSESRTGHHEPVTSKNQPKSDLNQHITDQHQQTTDQHQQITDQHQQKTDQHRPTSEIFQTTKGNLHKTSDLHRPRTRYSTEKPKQTTGRYTAVTQLFQSRNPPKSPRPSSSERPQKNQTAKLPSLDDLIITSVFMCNDGKFKIYSSSVCDGLIDCPDSSDERPDICGSSKTTLGTRKCKSDEFQCPTGKCVPVDSINLSHPDCWKDQDSEKNIMSKNCSHPNLLCDNNRKCVSAKDRCNEVWDCKDKSDERMSPFSFLTGNLTFKCANGYCVSQKVICNGYNDCGDNSDEISCDNHKITKHQSIGHFCAEHTCPTGKCIPKNQVCDGNNDCGDNSDEISCDDNKNSNHQSLHDSCTEYICNSGNCILNDQVCDGNNDCGDDSDESSCDAYAWSDNRGLIIGVSVLGGAVLITFMAVICVTIHYKRKFKNLTQETNRMDNHPPPYWQVVGVSVPESSETTEQKTTGEVNIPYGGTTALPQ